jgi:hypothetical protein
MLDAIEIAGEGWAGDVGVGVAAPTARRLSWPNFTCERPSGSQKC